MTLAIPLCYAAGMTTRIPRGAPDLPYVYDAPGHLMRRSHQIAVALFFEELRQSKTTPPQYASLVAIMDQPGVGQRRLADLVAIDRSTIGTLLQRLEKKGLIRRLTSETDQRANQLFITDAGRDLLLRSRKAIERSQERLLEPLKPRERLMFLRMLARLVHMNNDASRVPLKIAPQVEATDQD
jgi:MarR family transcriptional regulator, lower aerobic nicotinate degradation pathway regulator